MSLLSFTKKLRKPKETKKPEAEKPQGKEEVVEKKLKLSVSDTAVKIRLQPLVTEKGVLLQEDSVVAFRVARGATKQQIAAAVREAYKIEPRAVRVMNVRPKQRRRGKTEGWTTSWKKAYVKVDDVQAISTGP